jgi:hypothetical protein
VKALVSHAGLTREAIRFPARAPASAAAVKAEQRPVGAFAGAYLFPDMLASSWGIRGAEVVAGIVSVAGILLTVALPPEPKGKSLEELGSTPQSIASKPASGATLSQAS